MQIAQYTNESTAVRATVVLTANNGFAVVARDLDSDSVIELRFGFVNGAEALAYAAKHVADVIPAGTFVTI